MSLEIDHAPDIEQLSEETRNQLFMRLKPKDIEQFYMAYQLWSQQQQIQSLQLQMLALEQKISDNAKYMEQFQPSAIALAALVQLQACGVEDIDLLERMLERGDEWLDHNLQLLERCEELDLIGGNYTQWCEHALEGAYEWMNSIADASTSEAEPSETEITTTRQDSTKEVGDQVTEAQLLRKLIDEDEEIEETEETIQIATLPKNPRTTQPLTTADEQERTLDDTQKRAAIEPIKRPRTTQPLTSMDGQENTQSNAQKIATIEPIQSPRITQPLVIPDPDKETETFHPTQAMTETDQEDNAPASNTNTTEVNPELHINSENGQLKNLYLQKKGKRKRKQGFLRWLLAKILRK